MSTVWFPSDHSQGLRHHEAVLEKQYRKHTADRQWDKQVATKANIQKHSGKETVTLEISNSSSRNSHYWGETPPERLKAATQSLHGTRKQLKNTFNCWQEHTGGPNRRGSTTPGLCLGTSWLCRSQRQNPLDLSNCSSALRREPSPRKQPKFSAAISGNHLLSYGEIT